MWIGELERTARLKMMRIEIVVWLGKLKRVEKGPLVMGTEKLFERFIMSRGSLNFLYRENNSQLSEHL